MDKLNWKELEQIPVPQGVEERLSAKIDEWALAEQVKKQPRWAVRKVVRDLSVAASLVLCLGIGWYSLQEREPENVALQDSYQNPEEAYAEAEKALNLLAYNLNKGMSHLRLAEISNKEYWTQMEEY